jgi:hypothetical protein
MGVYVDFEVEGIDAPVFGANPVTLSVPYPETPAGGVSIGQLALYFYDEGLRRWVRVAGQAIDEERNVIVASIGHLTRFAIFAETFAGGVEQARVYPVPWVPNDGVTDNGVPWSSGDPNSGIVFDRLPPGSVVDIYDVSGRRVTTLSAGNPAGATTVRLTWDGENASGRAVASGAYVAVIRGGGGTVTRKVMVIR